MMNFFSMQSMGSYMKNAKMQMKWQQKKSSGDFRSNSAKETYDPVREQLEQIRQSQNDGSAKLSQQIDLKLKSGKKLTAEEMEYLKNTNPTAYQKAKEVEMEKASYERELKRCKTKDEVQRVKMAHVGAALSAVNTIQNNPNIPKEKKYELIMHELHKNAAVQESTRVFVESGRYAQLPTEAEKQKAEQDLAEAKKDELGIQDPEEIAKEEASKDPEAAEGETASPGTEEGKAEERETRAKAVAAEREITRMEAEVTPEALKVKRAKAKAAYKGMQASVGSTPKIDVKVE